MKQNTKKIQSDFDFTQDLDFVFETTGLAILVEDIEHNIILINTLFCNLFDINVKQNKLINTSSNTLFQQIKNCFKHPEKFEQQLVELSEKNIISKNQSFGLINGKNIKQHYYPLFKEDANKGHIWVYEQLQKPVNGLLTNGTFKIENALHFLPNEIAIYNTDLQIIFINKSYINNSEKRNWAKEKTLHQYFSYTNLPLEIAANREANFKEAIKSKKAISWQEENNENKTTLLRTCYPITDEFKIVTAVLEFSTDISEQKKLEIKLQQTVDNFYNILNTVNNVILLTDEKLQIQFINNYCQKITGLNYEELKGKSVFEILEITHYELYQKAFTILNNNSENESGIITIEDKDKNLNQYQYNLNRGFSVDSNAHGVVATLTDITTKKMQEAQLLELIKKEKELNELKSAFVNMVSHELRTPLTVISSSGEILELMLKSGKGYDDVSIYTKQIIDEVEKMTAFMQDLLMISKIEAGKILITPTNQNIISFVKNVISNGFAPYKDGRIVKLDIKRNEQNGSIDLKLLEHCLQNILANAFKYSAGKISPTARIGFSQTYFTISVIDEGIGIPKQDAQKLFTSFFRASNTGNISGTGIGLIVAKYFAEQHRGYITFKSKPNIGSIFTIKIPYVTSQS